MARGGKKFTKDGRVYMKYLNWFPNILRSTPTLPPPKRLNCFFPTGRYGVAVVVVGGRLQGGRLQVYGDGKSTVQQQRRGVKFAAARYGEIGRGPGSGAADQGEQNRNETER